MSYEVFLTETFQRSIKILKKKYRRIKDDLLNTIQTLEQDPAAGDPIPGWSVAILPIPTLTVCKTVIHRFESGCRLQPFQGSANSANSFFVPDQSFSSLFGVSLRYCFSISLSSFVISMNLTPIPSGEPSVSSSCFLDHATSHLILMGSERPGN